jgi:hypothetical protein
MDRHISSYSPLAPTDFTQLRDEQISDERLTSADDISYKPSYSSVPDWSHLSKTPYLPPHSPRRSPPPEAIPLRKKGTEVPSIDEEAAMWTANWMVQLQASGKKGRRWVSTVWEEAG